MMIDGVPFGPSEQRVINILHQLPEDSFVRNYVEANARISDTHVAHHLVAGLTVLAQCVPSYIGFPFGATPIRANIFGMLVGSSGSRKTVAVQNARRILVTAGDALAHSIVSTPPASREAFYDSLTDDPKKFIPYTEFGDFLATSARSYLTPLRTAYNDAADCAPLVRVRVRRRRQTEDGSDEGGESGNADPRVSLIGAVAQPFLDAHTEADDWGGGFFARFLTTCYERERLITIPEDGTPIIESVATWVRSHFDLWCGAAALCHYAPCRGLTADARAVYDEWLRTADHPANSSIAVGAATNRLGTHALKIALILAWDCMAPRANGEEREIQMRRHADPFSFAASSPSALEGWRIPLGILDVAMQIVQDVHYASVCRIAGGLANTREERTVVAVYRALLFADSEHRGLTRGEISKELRRDPRDVQHALNTLRERGEVTTTSREVVGPTGVSTVQNDVWILTTGRAQTINLDAARANRERLGL